MEVKYNIPRLICSNCVLEPSFVYQNAMTVIGSQASNSPNEFLQLVEYYYLDNDNQLLLNNKILNLYSMSIQDIIYEIVLLLNKNKFNFVGFKSTEFDKNYYYHLLTQKNIKVN